MPKQGPRQDEPFSPIDAHLADQLFRPEMRRHVNAEVAENEESRDEELKTSSDNVVSITPKKKAPPKKEPAAKSSAMTAGWKISTSPEDKRAITSFLRDLNLVLGDDSNLGVSNLGRALYMMAVKHRDEIFKVVGGKQFLRPDNNDHVALALLEEKLGDLIAEACFNTVRAERKEQ